MSKAFKDAKEKWFFLNLKIKFLWNRSKWMRILKNISNYKQIEKILFLWHLCMLIQNVLFYVLLTLEHRSNKCYRITNSYSVFTSFTCKKWHTLCPSNNPFLLLLTFSDEYFSKLFLNWLQCLYWEIFPSTVHL